LKTKAITEAILEKKPYFNGLSGDIHKILSIKCVRKKACISSIAGFSIFISKIQQKTGNPTKNRQIDHSNIDNPAKVPANESAEKIG